MMGIAFIGAVCGHVDRIVADASREVMLEKIRQQIAKKFGAKGGAVVEGNMAVIREGLEATQHVDYDAPEFGAIETQPLRRRRAAASRSRPACAAIGGATPDGGFFDRDYYEDMIGSAVPRRHDRRGAGAARHRPVHAGGQRAPGRTRACSAATCRSSRPTCAPAAWSARWSARTPRFRTRCTTFTSCCSPASSSSRSARGAARGPARRRSIR